MFGGYPGAPKSTRQLQASSGLFYEVFRKYDPANRLLGQAEAEVLSQELELARSWRRRSRWLAALTLDLVELKVRAEPVRAAADGRAIPRAALDR